MGRLRTRLAYGISAVIGVLLYALGAFLFAQSLSNDRSAAPFALFMIVLILMTAALFYSAVGLLLKAYSLFNGVIAAVIQIIVGGGVLMNILRSEFLPDDTVTVVYYCLAAFAPMLFGAVVLISAIAAAIIKAIKRRSK